MIGADPWRSKWLGVLIGTIGTVCNIASLAFMVLALALLATEDWGIGMAIEVGAFAGIYLGHFLVGLGRRLRARSAQELMSNDSRPPILYCRAFSDDDLLPGLEFSPEEQLVRVFNAVGPVVAIGKPGDKLWLPGAGRKYVVGDEWQSEVEQLMERSQLIIINASTSLGLIWEYQTAVARVAPNKIIIIPPKDKAEWELFREKTNAMTLPKDTQDADLISFDTTGTPHLIWRMNWEKAWWEDTQLIHRLLFKASF